MSVELLKIGGLAILCAAVGMILRATGSALAPLARIGGGLLIVALLMPSLSFGVERILFLFEGSGIERYASVMLRALGIAMLGRICSEICRDCGESGVADGATLAGKLAILSLCFPLIEEILGFASELLSE